MGVSDFNEMELDAIGEIMNISLGASATAVSTMLGTQVNITTPVVRVLASDEFEFRNLEPAVGVEIAYTEGLEGSNIMMFRRNDVRIIVGMLMGAEIPDEEFELDEINVSAICEVMNQMMGSSATALSEFLGNPVNISTPVSFPIDNEDSFKSKYFTSDVRMVVVRFSLEIEGKLESEFLNIMSSGLAKHLLEPFEASFKEAEQLQIKEDERKREELAAEAARAESQAAADQDQPEPEPVQPEPAAVQAEPQPAAVQAEPQPAPAAVQAEPQPVPAAVQAEPQPVPAAAQPAPAAYQPQPAMQMGQPMIYQSAPDPVMIQLLNQMQQSQMQMMELMKDMKTAPKQPARESNLIHPVNSPHLDIGMDDGTEEKANQEMLMKVPLELSVEVGRTKKLVKDILELTQGSLVVLDKMAGEQADLFVNGQCVARGDIVVVEDNFGIRITEIVARDLNPEIL